MKSQTMRKLDKSEK